MEFVRDAGELQDQFNLADNLAMTQLNLGESAKFSVIVITAPTYPRQLQYPILAEASAEDMFHVFSARRSLGNSFFPRSNCAVRRALVYARVVFSL